MTGIARFGVGSGGGIYINDIVPNGGGNVGAKVFKTGSNDNILESCSADDLNLRVYVVALIGASNLRPAVTVNGVSVGNWDHVAYETDNRVLFRGYADIVLVGAVVTATHEDGVTDSCLVALDARPVISAAEFVGLYPIGPTGVVQTEVKDDDVFSVSVTADIDFDRIEFENSGALKSDIITVAQGASATAEATIDATGTTTQSLGGRVRVSTPSGSWGDWFSITNTVDCNDTVPSVSFGLKTYPVGQEALKGSESATVVNTITGWSRFVDEITYSSPGGQLSIQSDLTHESPKQVSRIAGSYNVSSNNFAIAVTRIANGAQGSGSTIVKIANVLPVIDVSIVGASRMRTGGNDGTPVQSYAILIESSQDLISTPVLSNAVSDDNSFGTFSGSGDTWTATYQADDNNPVGAFSWHSLSATNLSGMIQTSISSGVNYEVGGFVSRTIAIQGSVDNGEINVGITEWTSKVVFSWTADSTVVIKGSVGDTTQYLQDKWTIDALNTSPTRILIQDTSAALSSTDVSYISLEEGE